MTFSPDDVAISSRGLSKRFESLLAVDHVDFDVDGGEIFAFLGPNGAGKTTTINMLTGLTRPSSGSIAYFGREYTSNIKAAQHLMGIVPDESNLYPELSGRQNLEFCGSLYGIDRRERSFRAADFLERFELIEHADRKFAHYSKGMKRRLTIAAGLIHQPKILFLDEPTTGVDVASARRIRAMLSGLRLEGVTIFLTTHYIEEAERLCDRVAFIVGGRIVKTGNLDTLMAEVEQGNVLELVSLDGQEIPGDAIEASFPEVRSEKMQNGVIRVYSESKLELGTLLRLLESHDIPIAEARLIKPSLEDVFVKVTGVGSDFMKDQSRPVREALNS